jgi:glycosyltransferase involved in cell wall biosynthesis
VHRVDDTGGAGAPPRNRYAVRVTPDSKPRPRIALAHDWLVGYRGGEAVLDRIVKVASGLGEVVGLYTMFDDGRPLTPAIDALRGVLTASPLNSGRLFRRWLLPLYPGGWGVGRLSRALRADHERLLEGSGRGIDLVISTSSAAMHGLSPPPGVPHLCYCHSPARYLWSQSDQYAGGIRGVALNVLGQRLRDRDRDASRNVTRWLANSRHTQREIARCFRAESRVVFPPVRTEYFTPGALDGARSAESEGGFMLYAGALEPYKRVDLCIDAAKEMRRRLVVAGSGSCSTLLWRRAANDPRITFEGRVSDERLRELYRRADLVLFPQQEDFGIVAAEAQACGTPVVALAAGGALDTVVSGCTGVLVEPPITNDGLRDRLDVESLWRGIEQCPRKPECSVHCRRNAEAFSESVFDAAMAAEIRTALEHVQSAGTGLSA